LHKWNLIVLQKNLDSILLDFLPALLAFWVSRPLVLETPCAVIPIPWVFVMGIWPVYTIDAQGTTTVFRAYVLHFATVAFTETISIAFSAKMTTLAMTAYIMPSA